MLKSTPGSFFSSKFSQIRLMYSASYILKNTKITHTGTGFWFILVYLKRPFLMLVIACISKHIHVYKSPSNRAQWQFLNGNLFLHLGRQIS